MTTTAFWPTCEPRSQMPLKPDRSDPETKPWVGLLATLLAFLLVVALLALAASLTPMQIPGEPVWFDGVFV